jgi:hypothetical protein
MNGSFDKPNEPGADVSRSGSRLAFFGHAFRGVGTAG